MPVRRLKVDEKWLWLEKPASKAISTSGVPDVESSRQVNSIRSRRMYSVLPPSTVGTSVVTPVHSII
jgi:hypothetical protein